METTEEKTEEEMTEESGSGLELDGSQNIDIVHVCYYIILITLMNFPMRHPSCRGKRIEQRNCDK